METVLEEQFVNPLADCAKVVIFTPKHTIISNILKNIGCQFPSYFCVFYWPEFWVPGSKWRGTEMTWDDVISSKQTDSAYEALLNKFTSLYDKIF